MRAFRSSRFGELIFGDGHLAVLGDELASRQWRIIVLVISRGPFSDDESARGFMESLQAAGITVRTYRYDRLPDDEDPFTATRGPYREASPEVVDAIVRRERERPDVPASAVVAIGGGSAVDTGKAVSAALMMPGPVTSYLEGIGSQSPPGDKVPFVAVPTTAGTGSEASKNAVLSQAGTNGFKKSLRHDRYVPDLVLIDPLLHLSCPRSTTAASGLDAITQLLEAYVATGATPITDALAIEGLAAAGRSFLPAVDRGQSDTEARAGMAYAAYLSGICLGNAGLGVVHGLAGPAGAHSSVPHGTFCGLLLAPATEMLAERLRGRREGIGALAKLAAAGRALTGSGTGSLEPGIGLLSSRIAEFVRVADLPGLSRFDFDESLLSLVARDGNSKNSPVDFDESDRRELLARCL